MERITELTISRDGEIRSAKVLLPSKNIINRRINLLYPLEAEDDTCDIDNPGINNTSQTEENIETHRARHSMHIATANAKQKIKVSVDD